MCCHTGWTIHLYKYVATVLRLKGLSVPRQCCVVPSSVGIQTARPVWSHIWKYPLRMQSLLSVRGRIKQTTHQAHLQSSQTVSKERVRETVKETIGSTKVARSGNSQRNTQTSNQTNHQGNKETKEKTINQANRLTIRQTMKQTNEQTNNQSIKQTKQKTPKKTPYLKKK